MSDLWCWIVFCLIVAAGLVYYRLDQRKRESGKTEERGEPWNWPDLQ